MPHALAPTSDRQNLPRSSGLGVGVVDPQERIDVLPAHLGTHASGLSSPEAERRLVPFGRNGSVATRSPAPRRAAGFANSSVSSCTHWRCCSG